MIKIVIGPRSGMNWVPLSMTEMSCPFARSALGMVRMWAEDHLTADNQELGRDGAVCRYVAPSMRRDLMRAGRIPGAHPWPSFVRLVPSDAMEPRLTAGPTADVEAYPLEPEEVEIEALARTNGKPVPAGPHRSD
ncbi:DUF6875 domain-containing protein [Nocardia sp. NPDC004604]|uniref:DUF6875 domain-containing protein n=1 Tax=Nocardia sp. NPDC004604 TaxID=3157013 RepID=UPI0033A3CB32